MSQRKIKLLAHRGAWAEEAAKKNTIQALRRAIELGVGFETDLRDVAGTLMIAHDPGDKTAYPVEDLLRELGPAARKLKLALNIKSDGLQSLVKKTFAAEHFDYFLFDMSAPDHLSSLRSGLTCYTRLSDVETEPLLLQRAPGIWVDSLERDWIDDRQLKDLFLKYRDKVLVFVSPELHRRSHLKFWEQLHQEFAKHTVETYLCVDYLHEALEYFGTPND